MDSPYCSCKLTATGAQETVPINSCLRRCVAPSDPPCPTARTPSYVAECLTITPGPGGESWLPAAVPVGRPCCSSPLKHVFRLCAVDGAHIITTEGLGSSHTGMHAVQVRSKDSNSGHSLPPTTR